MFPIVIHKGIPATIALPANTTLVVKGFSNTGLEVFTFTDSFSTAALDGLKVGSHRAILYAAEALVLECGAVYVGSGITADMSDAERMLHAVNAVLEGKALDDIQSYTVMGRSVVKMSVSELQTLAARYQAIVQKEQAAVVGAKKPFFKQIVLR